MPNKKLPLPITAVILALTFVGCTAIQKEDASDTEQLLAAAGFQMKLANTPEKLAHLQTFDLYG